MSHTFNRLTVARDVSRTHQRVEAERDLVCFSHLRWDFVYQRPQHLLSRAARTRRVIFIEEPIRDVARPCLDTRRDESGVLIVTPHLPHDAGAMHIRTLLDFFLSTNGIHDFVAWYYTPMALEFSRHLRPAATIYDCMDELSAFAGAPADIREKERDLLARADLVLTGGRSLYEAKRALHGNVQECPSSVDVSHFARARQSLPEPADQEGIPKPRIGFFGVLDERLDLDLLGNIAQLSPGWQFVMVGPVAKIDPGRLPSRPNIHYLGSKSYKELPSYIAGWEVAMLPFARNEATRFISPTKTPEYLAAGRPVVSTSIADVVRPYGEEGLARIADTPELFVEAIRAALCDRASRWLSRADAFLSGNSWDATWSRIAERLRAVVGSNTSAPRAANDSSGSTWRRRAER
jgi:glycosyltransferase involved in cell wall biosynthesis